MNIFLKVKICTLAAESRAIRTQQQNFLKRAGKPPSSLKISLLPGKTFKPEDLSDSVREEFRAMRLERRKHKAKIAVIKMGMKPLYLWPSLQQHRRNEVRDAARHALLAYAFLRKRDYFQLENKCYEQPDWREVEKNIKRFTTELDQRIVLQRFEEWRQRGREDQDRYKGEQEAA